jgi:N-acyl-D-aspartate/D-glutamate deacylase
MAALDLKIVGGDIVDGTGKPRYRGDVGIKDGRVVALGQVTGDADRTIDATGRVVAPGFVDVHTHYDAQVMWDRMLSISPWHGVTTVVIGNCGFGLAPTRPQHRDLMMRTLEKVEGMSLASLQAGIGPDWGFETFPQYMDVVEKRGAAINIGVLVGHTPLRTYVMGEHAVQRAATPDEVAQQGRLVREAMEAGAIGFATSHAVTHNGYDGNPVPSRMAAIEEIDALVAAMASSGRGIVQATIGRTLLWDEFERFARAHGVAVSWTALLSGLAGPGSHRKHVERAARDRAEGLRIVPQVACRPLNFDFDFNEPFPFEMRPLFASTMKTDRAGRAAIYKDPAFREAFKRDCAKDAHTPLSGWYERAVVSIAPGQPELEERPLLEAAARAGKDPVDFALDMSIASDFAARFRFPNFNHDEAEVAELIADPNMVIALSDAGAHASQLCDACYATHLLGYWVRERGALTVEDAVHKLTQVPAEVFGITDRGLLAEGRPADVVVFDLARIGASGLTRVHDLPANADRLRAEAYGIDAVVVNGTLLRQAGKDVVDAAGPLPGRLLRGGRAA